MEQWQYPTSVGFAARAAPVSLRRFMAGSFFSGMPTGMSSIMRSPSWMEKLPFELQHELNKNLKL